MASEVGRTKRLTVRRVLLTRSASHCHLLTNLNIGSRCFEEDHGRRYGETGVEEQFEEGSRYL
jgi:hypothetical protein